VIIRSSIKRKARRKKPSDDPQRLEWLRELPCFICYQFVYRMLRKERSRADFGTDLLEIISSRGRQEQDSRTEAAHVGLSTSRRGLKQKYPDAEAIPLCGLEHHREGRESIHKLGPDRFFDRHGVEGGRDAAIELFQWLYEVKERDDRSYED